MAVNSSWENTTDFLDVPTLVLLTDDPSFRVVKFVFYIVVFLVSVAGNGLVCYVVWKLKRMRTIVNIFLCNLACADLFVTLICIPFDLHIQELNYIWPYGAVLCKIIYPLQTLSSFGSVFTLTGISLTRYRAIVHPLKRQVRTRESRLGILLIWILSLLCVVPYIMALEIQKNSCVERWSIEYMRKYYTLGIFLLQYVIPLGIMLVAYIRIGRELNMNSGKIPHQARSCYLRDTGRVVTMLKIVTSIFALCMLPNHMVWIVHDLYDSSFKHFSTITIFTNFLLYLNSASNPIVYNLCNENFRNAFRPYYQCLPCFREKKNGMKFNVTRTIEVT